VIDRRGPIARFALSRQSRRSPNRYDYTASRSPSPCHLPFVSRYRSAAPFTRHPHQSTSAARFHPTAQPDSRYVSITRPRFSSSSVRVPYISHPGPSTPALAISKSSCVFRRLRVLSHRVPIYSHSFGSPRHRPPLRAASLGVSGSHPLGRDVVKPLPQRVLPARQLRFIARSPTHHRSARSFPFLRLRALLGVSLAPLLGPLPLSPHRLPDHVPSRGPIRTSTTPWRILDRDAR
jgi:hypothetical protein